MAASTRHLQATPATGPGELSPFFAQTGAELDLDDSDIDDLDLHAEAGASGSSVYEMRERDASRERFQHVDHMTSGAPLWDAGDEDPALMTAHHGESSSTVASFQLYTPDEEDAVRRKFDRKLVVFVALLYMLSFLDRSNIGNARIAGMEDDLQSDPPRDNWYEWALTAFYISYVSGSSTLSLLWSIIPAHIYVSMLVLTWGVTASLQAVAVSYPMLIALRLLLGIGEAGFTGIPFYLSFFFKRHELAFRTAIFISAAPLATSFASSLAWVIVKFAEAGPIAPWRLLFLVEGFPSVIVSVIAWSAIPDSPQTAHYLTKREKKVARLRLRSEQPATVSSLPNGKPSSRLHVLEALLVLRDPTAWISAAMFFLTNMAYSSLPVFLPRILTEMGHDALHAQALSAPPYLIAFLAVLLTAHLSDRSSARTIPIILHALASAAGYAVLALAGPLSLPPILRYLAVYPAAIGFFNVVTLLITWAINNQPGATRQGAGFALLQLVGQCGPFVGTRLYPDRDAPFYTSGMQACACAMLVVALLAGALRLLLRHRNQALDRAEHGSMSGGSADAAIGEDEGLVGRRRKIQGEPFRYML